MWACVGYGHPTEPPASESLKTLEKRADRGDAGAEYALGKMYLEGRGVRLDEGAAARWYRKAAERGYAAAEAARWYRQAASAAWIWRRWRWPICTRTTAANRPRPC